MITNSMTIIDPNAVTQREIACKSQKRTRINFLQGCKFSIDVWNWIYFHAHTKQNPCTLLLALNMFLVPIIITNFVFNLCNHYTKPHAFSSSLRTKRSMQLTVSFVGTKI
jgi:hypothetical protein